MVRKKKGLFDNFGFGITGILILFFNYLQSRTISRLIIDFVYIMMVLSTTCGLYIIGTNFSTIFLSSDLKEARDLNSQLIANKDASLILGKILDSTGASRSYIFKFHDGLRGVGGIPFYYVTMTVEETAPGVSKEILNNQRLPVSIFPNMYAIAEGKCVTIKQETSAENQQFYLKRQGIKEFSACPIYDLNNVLIGFTGVDFIEQSSKMSAAEIEKNLSEYSKNITGVLLLNNR